MLGSIIVFLAVLSVLVLVHELGHFLTAKKMGVKVLEFGWGLPPRVWGKKIGETIYSINAMPIGGFVKLLGEDVEEGDVNKKEYERAFFVKKWWQKAIMVSAGVVMNFLLAIAIFTYIYSKLGIPTETPDVYVVEVVTDSPAATAGLVENDRVVTVAGEEIDSTEEFIEVTRGKTGEEIEIEVERDGQRVAVSLTPRESPPEGEGPLGVSISNVIAKYYPWYEMPFRSAYYGTKEALSWTKLVVGGLAKLAADLVTTGQVPKDVSGPVGIFQVTAEVAKTGYINVLQLMGVLSINLAVLNILPFPALDGGRLLFIGLEAIVGRKVAPRYERWVHTVGLALLVGLIILITFRDIQRLISGEKLF